jgi:hypothetical protein
MRIVAVQVRELVGLVVDKDKYRVFGTKKRSKAIAKGHCHILCCRVSGIGFAETCADGALPEPVLPFLFEMR